MAVSGGLGHAFVVAGLTVVGLLVVGCSAPEPAVTAPTPTVDSQAVLEAETIGAYFDGLASADASGFRAARAASSPGSPALLFVKHQQAMLAPTPDGGQQSWQTATSVEGSSVTWSTSTSGRPQEDQEFSSFEFDERDRLVGWLIDGEHRLTDQVADISQKLTADAVSVMGRTAYLSGTKELQITYLARGRSGTVTAGPYVNKGKAVKGTHSPYQLDVRPKGSAAGWSLYRKVSWGGSVEFKINYESTLSLAVAGPQQQ